MSQGITVVVAAFNEEENIAAAIDSVHEGFKGYAQDYEILVVNDGSEDDTGAIAEAQAQKDPRRVRVVHNDRNRGNAYSLYRGYQLAAQEYVTVFPGDNDLSPFYLRDFLAHRGSADILMTYMLSMQNRPWHRRALSRSFVVLLNTLFGLKLRNYNGAPLYRSTDIRALKVRSSQGMTLLAECLVRLIKSGATYKEIPSDFIGRKGGQSRALRFRNFIECFQVISCLIWDVCIRRKPRGELAFVDNPLKS